MYDSYDLVATDDDVFHRQVIQLDNFSVVFNNHTVCR
jgi:hypothetical protein